MKALKKQIGRPKISSNVKNHKTNLFVNLKGDSRKNAGYEIKIGSGNLHNFGTYLSDIKMPRRLFVITNKTIYKLYGKLLKNSLEEGGFDVFIHTIGDGEKYKSSKTYLEILDNLVKRRDEENIGIVSFGGGVVGDIAGFAAGSFNRGVPYIQVPTTLIAQVDSAVGGKTGINWGGSKNGKNLVGLIYQPAYVFMDVSLLKTLPKREIRSGLSEVIKYGFIKDKNFLDFLKNNREKVLRLDHEAIMHVVRRCCEIKKALVEQDERDDVAAKGIRALLNFGHTFGHALEAATSFKKFKHGEAISIGMAGAAHLSQELGLITKDDVKEVGELLSSYALPVTCEFKDMNALIECMKSDKKFAGGKTCFVVLKKLGEGALQKDISWKTVKKAYSNVLKKD